MATTFKRTKFQTPDLSDFEGLFAVLGVVGIIAVIIFIWIWFHQPFYYEAKVVGDFKIEATSTYQEYRSRLDCRPIVDGNGNSSLSCSTVWAWDTMYKLVNTYFGRDVDTLECHYDRVADGNNSRWLSCEVNKWMLMSYRNNEESKQGWCIFNDPKWAYIEKNTKMTISENRAYEVHCQ